MGGIAAATPPDADFAKEVSGFFEDRHVRSSAGCFSTGDCGKKTGRAAAHGNDPARAHACLLIHREAGERHFWIGLREVVGRPISWKKNNWILFDVVSQAGAGR